MKLKLPINGALIKSICYRICAYGITIIVFLILFRQLPFVRLGFAVALIELCKFWGYYMFEKIYPKFTVWISKVVNIR